MSEHSPPPRTLAEGRGWRVNDLICTAGPADRPFEECHTHYSVGAVLAGTFTYRSALGETLLTPGALLLGNAGAGFECRHEHGVGDHCVAFHFDPEVFEEFAGGLRVRPGFPVSRLPPAHEALPLLEKIAVCAAGADAMEWEELAFRLGARAVTQSHEGAASIHATARDQRCATAAVRFIERHYDKVLSLDGLAARSGLSRFHFLRVFRQTVGVTPHQYLIRTRLGAAAARLRSAPANVLDVAMECGFGDLSEFTRRFRRAFRLTPRRYAERYGRPASAGLTRQ